MLNSKYREYFLSLNPDEVGFVCEALSRKYKMTNEPGDCSVATLLGLCERYHLGHAEVVTALAGSPSPVAAASLAKLIGHPITKTAVTQPVLKQTRQRKQTIDPRVIKWIVPTNPKKPGSRAHRLFELYKVGMTVTEFIQAGGRASAIRYDLAHGYIGVDNAR